MEFCRVCESEIRTDLEEFGDPKNPVCAQCWLQGKIPGNLPEDQIRKLEEEIKEQEAYLDGVLKDYRYYEEYWESLDEDETGYAKELKQEIRDCEFLIDDLYIKKNNIINSQKLSKIVGLQPLFA